MSRRQALTATNPDGVSSATEHTKDARPFWEWRERGGKTQQTAELPRFSTKKKQQQNTETIPISFFSLPKLFVG